MGSGSKKKSGGGDDQRPLLWRLPEVTSTELGKIGPAFGLGVGCGVGAGVGFFGGNFFPPSPLSPKGRIFHVFRCSISRYSWLVCWVDI